MDDVVSVIVNLTFIVIVGMAAGLTIQGQTIASMKLEAFNRGYMVECLGKTGYHWECE